MYISPYTNVNFVFILRDNGPNGALIERAAIKTASFSWKFEIAFCFSHDENMEFMEILCTLNFKYIFIKKLSVDLINTIFPSLALDKLLQRSDWRVGKR